MPEISNISLRYFQALAKQSGQGEIRFSRDDDARLVNKGALGSLGGKIWTLVGDIRSALSNTPDTRRERNERALNGFREALIAGYGDYGRVAFDNTGLGNVQDAVLTGTHVLNMIEVAERLRGLAVDEQRDRHRGGTGLYDDVIDALRNDLDVGEPRATILERDLRTRVYERCRFESDLYGDTLTDEQIVGFAREEKDIVTQGARHRGDTGLYDGVIAELRGALQAESPRMIDSQEQELRNRVDARCKSESRRDSPTLSDEQIAGFAEEEKDIVLERLGRGDNKKTRRQQTVSEVRTGLHQASNALLAGAAGGKLPASLERIVKSLRFLDDKGDISARGPDRISQYARAMFAQLISEQIVDRDGNVDHKSARALGRLQHSMLQEASSLREAYDEPGTNVRKAVIEGLIEAMARTLGPITHTPEGDLERLGKPPKNVAPPPTVQEYGGGNPTEALVGEDDDLYGSDDEDDVGLGERFDGRRDEIRGVDGVGREVVFGNWADPVELYDALSQDAELLTLGVREKVLSNPRMRDEFWLRFEARCRRESELETRRLSPERVTEIGQTEMKQLLLEGDDLERVQAGRSLVEQAGAAFFYTALDPGGTKDDLERALEDFAREQRRPGFGHDFSREPVSVAAVRFMSRTIEQSKLTPRDELSALRDRMLEEGSSVRELYQELSLRAEFGEGPADRAKAGTMRDAIEDLIHGLCAGLNEGPETSLKKLYGLA